jgi:hypothetical protein
VYRLQRCGYLTGYLLVFTTKPASKVSVIEGAEKYRIKNDGMDNVVDGVEA